MKPGKEKKIRELVTTALFLSITLAIQMLQRPPPVTEPLINFMLILTTLLLAIIVQHKERHYLTSQQAQKFLDAIEHPLVQVAAITLVNTGLRVSELCHLTLEDVDLDKGLI